MTTIAAAGDEQDPKQDGQLVPASNRSPVPAGGGNFPSADIVRANLEASSLTISPPQIDSILWLLEYGRRNRLTQARLGALIEWDGSVVSRLFSGKYPAAIEPIIENIDAHRRLLAQETVSKDRPVCDTWVLTEIAKTCNMVRKAETVGILTGRSHTGKSTALTTYTSRNNHGQTIYVKMPPGGAPRMFLLSLARACGISERNAYDQLRDRLIRFFRPGMLLIVDEMHQTLIGRKLQTVTLEVLRDLHDTAGCGLLLCGTPIFVDSFKDDKVRLFFEQVDNRTTIKRRLPDAAPWSDVLLVLTAYGLPPVDASPAGEAIIRAVTARNGLGKLTKFLAIAQEVARNRKELFAWQHVVGTDATLKSWERGDGPKELEGGR